MQFGRQECVPSWKEGNFRSLLGRSPQLRAEDRRGAFEAEKRGLLGGAGSPSPGTNWPSGCREKSRPAAVADGQGLGAGGPLLPEARWSATWLDRRRPRRLASSASAQIQPREMGAHQAEQPQ